jgi:hypothetical protein
MRLRRSTSFVFNFIISSFLILTGCSKPVLKMPTPLPPIVKRYKHITIRSRVSGMHNTGIYLNKEDLYSIVATGSIDMYPGGPSQYHDVRPEDGWPLMARIGKNPYFRPLNYGDNASMSDSYHSGNLFLGYRTGKVGRYGRPLNPEYYDDDTGSFSVDIIVWEKDDFVQIADLFEQMRARNPKNKAVLDALLLVRRRKEAVQEDAEFKKKVVPQEVPRVKEAVIPPTPPEVKEAAVPPKVKEFSMEIENLLIRDGPQMIDGGKYDEVLELIEDLPAERRKHVQIQTLACFANLKAYLSEADQVKKLNWWALRKRLLDWGDREATPILVPFLKAEDSYLRKYAAELLGHIGDERALKALRDVGEHDESHRVRRYAKWAYEEISGRGF